ncbi:MAG: CUAEP/CCAEP-tail radical SAM (seleno)protein, partial [Terriglobia bacterium]
RKNESRAGIFSRVRALAREAAGMSSAPLPEDPLTVARAAIPYLTEPWYC